MRLHKIPFRQLRSLLHLFSVFFLTAVAGVFVPFSSFAISDGELGIGVVYQNSVRPDKFVYELKPGDSFEDEILISHTGTQVASVKLYPEDKNEGDSKLPPEKQYLSQWIKIEKPSFDFPPGPNQTVKFTLTVPSDAEKGDYQGVIFVHEPPRDGDPPVRVTDANGNTFFTKVGRKIGVGVYLKVTDDPHMPVRTKKNLSPTVNDLRFMTYAIFGITFFIGLLLIIQERRKIGASRN